MRLQLGNICFEIRVYHSLDQTLWVRTDAPSSRRLPAARQRQIKRMIRHRLRNRRLKTDE